VGQRTAPRKVNKIRLPYNPEFVEKIDDGLRKILDETRMKILNLVVTELGMHPDDQEGLPHFWFVCRNCGLRIAKENGLCEDCQGE